MNRSERSIETRRLFTDQRAVRRQDPLTWTRIFERFNDGMVRIGILSGLPLQEAEDNAQDVWIGVVRNMRREDFDFGDNPGGYIWTATGRRAIDRRRKSQREVVGNADDVRNDDSRLEGPSLEDEIMARIIDPDIIEKLQTLYPGIREAFILQVLFNLRYEEIADRLGIPVGTVASRVKRGRDKMQKELAGSSV